MLIPMRGGESALALEFDVDALAESFARPNVELERAFASVLCVLRDSWPDWPIEVWACCRAVGDEADDDEEPAATWQLGYRVFFAGEGPADPDVAAMADFVARGLRRALRLAPDVRWAGIDPDWKPMWLIDEAVVYRALAPERSLEPSVYLLGHYAGDPALFSAALEAWPLHGSGLPIETTDVDIEWAFAGGR